MGVRKALAASAMASGANDQIGLRCASMLLMHGSVGGFAALTPVFLSLRFTPAEVGVLTGLPAMLGIFANPLVSAVCDMHGMHKSVLVLFTIFHAVVRLSLILPGLPSSCLAVLTVVYGLLLGPMLSIVDASASAALGDKYGSVRSFGSLGFGLVALLCGSLLTLSGGPSASANFLSMLTLTFALEMLCVLCFIKLDFSALKQGSGTKEQTKEESRPSLLTLLRQVASVSSVHFSAVTLLNGAFLGGLSTAHGMFLKELGADGTIIGAAGFIGPLSEVVWFQTCGKLLQRLGLSGCLAAAQAAFMCRFIWYAALPTNLDYVESWIGISRQSALWASLPSEGLHGLCFAVSWTAILKYAQDIAPPGLQASSITLISTIHWGVGLGVGAWASGLLVDTVGSQKTFGALTAFAALNLGLSLLGCLCYGSDWSPATHVDSSHDKKD